MDSVPMLIAIIFSACVCVGGDSSEYILCHVAWLTETVALLKAFSECVTCNMHCRCC